MKMIDAVYILPDGLVVAFRDGEPILQGPWQEMASQVFLLCTPNTLIYDHRAFQDLLGDVIERIKRALAELDTVSDPQ